MTDTLMTILVEAGFRYDSSVFPCPVYYGAKALVLAANRVRNRVSHAVLDHPHVLRAPTVPYRSGTPYWSRGRGLLELPIQVAGPLRLPFIGTSLVLLGSLAARFLGQSLIGLPFINLELHGLDFLEAADVPESLRGVQPDLHVSLSRKLAVLGAVLQLLTSHGYQCVRLDEAASWLGRERAETSP